MQRLVFVVPESKQHDDVLRIEPALLQRIVQHGEHCGGSQFLLRGGAHDAADECGEERGWRGLPADVAENDGGLVGRVFEKVVEIAADGAGGKKADGEFGVFVHRRRGGQQAELDFARHARCRARVAAPGV